MCRDRQEDTAPHILDHGVTIGLTASGGDSLWQFLKHPARRPRSDFLKTLTLAEPLAQSNLVALEEIFKMWSLKLRVFTCHNSEATLERSPALVKLLGAMKSLQKLVLLKVTSPDLLMSLGTHGAQLSELSFSFRPVWNSAARLIPNPHAGHPLLLMPPFRETLRELELGWFPDDDISALAYQQAHSEALKKVTSLTISHANLPVLGPLLAYVPNVEELHAFTHFDQPQPGALQGHGLTNTLRVDFATCRDLNLAYQHRSGTWALSSYTGSVLALYLLAPICPISKLELTMPFNHYSALTVVLQVAKPKMLSLAVGGSIALTNRLFIKMLEDNLTPELDHITVTLWFDPQATVNFPSVAVSLPAANLPFMIAYMRHSQQSLRRSVSHSPSPATSIWSSLMAEDIA